MTRGYFVTLEGGEGAGKSTQLRLLADTLIARGLDVLATREPGGSPGAEEIRTLLVSGEPGHWDGLTEALLHNAARRDHLVRTVWPALEAGRWVLCDRFADSTLAYQGYGRGLDHGVIAQLHALTTGGFVPDLTLILDLPPEVGMARTRNRRGGGEDRYERMDLDFHRRLRQGFLDIARREPERCVVVDASQPLEVVAAAVRDAVTQRLPVPAP